MGAFYTNVLVQGPTRDEIVAHFRKTGREAYVSPTVGRSTVVYDAMPESQDEAVLTQLASNLSRLFDSTALASLVHDDDVLMHWLFRDGQRVDAYDSWPGYDEGRPRRRPRGGDARALCQLFGADQAIEEVDRILRAQGKTNPYPFESHRHRALLQALGLPLFAANLGFHHIDRGEVPDGLRAGDLVRTP
jgi:hypothetical protein